MKTLLKKLSPTAQGLLQLIRLHRPIGIYLLIWPVLWSLWIAEAGRPRLWLLFVFIVGSILMRSAGCIVNDYADRHFDGHVARTKERPLVSGKLTIGQAWLTFAMLIALAFILVMTTNSLTIKMSFVALATAMLYPFTKRWFAMPQLFLGLAFAWGVPMVFAASVNYLPPVAWWLYLVAVLWPIAYDTYYAMADRSDDVKIGLYSSAITLGDWDRTFVISLQTIILIILIGIGYELGYGVYYYLGISTACLLMLYQFYITRNREPYACLKAFLNNHWFGAAIFLGLLLQYITNFPLN